MSNDIYHVTFPSLCTSWYMEFSSDQKRKMRYVKILFLRYLHDLKLVFESTLSTKLKFIFSQFWYKIYESFFHVPNCLSSTVISFCEFIKQIIWILHWIIQHVLQIVANIDLIWFFTLKCFLEILWNFKTHHLRPSLCWHMHNIWYHNRLRKK